MKKNVFGLLVCFIVLAGCGGQSADESSGTGGEGKTIESLEKKVADLTKSNENWQKSVESLEKELEEEKSGKDEETMPSSSETEEKAMFSNNEEVSLGNGEKETLKMKISECTTNQSSFPSHMISLDEYDTTKMIAVTIEFTNVALGEPFYPYAQYFNAYAKDGTPLERVSQQNGQDAAAEGRSGKTQIFFELPILGTEFNEVEIDFVPQDVAASFDLTVSH